MRIEKKESTTKTVRIKKTYLPGKSYRQFEGSFDIDFSPNLGKIESIIGERVRTLHRFSKVISSDTTKLNVVRIDNDKNNSAEIERKMNMVIAKPIVETLSGKYRSRLSLIKSKTEILDGSRFSDLKTELREISSEDKNGIHNLSRKIVAMLTIKPETSYEFAEIMNSLTYKDLKYRTIASALSEVGTKEAQDALINSVDQSIDNLDLVVHLMPYIGLLNEPNQDTEEKISNIANTSDNVIVRMSAELNLGSIAGNIKKSNPERALKIMEELADKLASVNSVDDKAHYIMVLGNIGVDEQVDHLEPFLHGKDQKLKLKAYDALRLVDTPRSLGFLIDGAQGDDEGIRQTSIESLRTHSSSLELFNFYKNRIKVEKNISLLKMLFNNMSSMSDYHSESQDYMKQYLRNCGHKDLCTYIESLVSPTKD